MRWSPSPVPNGATAVGNPARIIVAKAQVLDEKQAEREALAAKLGFSAYGVTEGDDPLSQALKGLIDNASGHEHQIMLLWQAIEKLAKEARTEDARVFAHRCTNHRAPRCRGAELIGLSTSCRPVRRTWCSVPLRRDIEPAASGPRRGADGRFRPEAATHRRIGLDRGRQSGQCNKAPPRKCLARWTNRRHLSTLLAFPQSIWLSRQVQNQGLFTDHRGLARQNGRGHEAQTDWRICSPKPGISCRPHPAWASVIDRARGASAAGGQHPATPSTSTRSRGFEQCQPFVGTASAPRVIGCARHGPATLQGGRPCLVNT